MRSDDPAGWHGKYTIVKRENNQLRKQVWRLKQQRAEMIEGEPERQ